LNRAARSAARSRFFGCNKMYEKDIFFKALLANVDSSILEVDFLEHGFDVECISAYDGIDLISRIGPNPNKSFLRTDLENVYNCIDRSKNPRGDMYFFSGTFEDLDSAKIKVKDYLEPVVKLMRLFKENSINISMGYYYSNDGLVPINPSPSTRSSYFEEKTAPIGQSFTLYPFIYRNSNDDIYSLESYEIPVLRSFIEDIIAQNEDPTLRDSILKIAYDMYDLSYYVPSTPQALLNLMISLEALFNPSGGGELRYRISRNVAVLIGNDKDESKHIYKYIKNIYMKRSNLVHTGKVSSRSTEDVFRIEELLKLRDYVRRSIIKFNEFIAKNPGKKKAALLEILEYSDFGESPC